MRYPPRAQLLHYNRFARDGNFLCPFSAYFQLIASARERQVDQFDLRLLAGLVIYE